MTTRELGLVREALTAAGMDISYAYEDLVFLEHNGFLLQFTDTPRELIIHVHNEADTDRISGAVALLRTKGADLNLVFTRGGRYRIHEADGDNIKIELYRSSS